MKQNEVAFSLIIPTHKLLWLLQSVREHAMLSARLLVSERWNRHMDEGSGGGAAVVWQHIHMSSVKHSDFFPCFCTVISDFGTLLGVQKRFVLQRKIW